MRGQFAFGGGAVVTGRAGAQYLCMVDFQRELPVAGAGMAVAAIAGTCDMRRILTWRDGAVVTTGTGANGLGMLKCDRAFPAHRGVALLAQIGACYMVRGLAGGRCSVTATAPAGNARVAEGGQAKRIGGVAESAIFGGGYMVGRFVGRGRRGMAA